MMKDLELKNLLTYMNSVYHIDEKIKKIFDTRRRQGIETVTVLKMVLMGFILQYPSFNELFTYHSSIKRMKHYVQGPIPKTDAARKILKLLDKTGLRKLHESMIQKIRTNRTFRSGTIDGYVVAAIDGVELFSSTKKSCKKCLSRKLHNGLTEYFHRSVVCMTVGSDPHIIIGQEMLSPRDGGQKDEGELTAGKRLMEHLYKIHHHFADIIVADALYLNAPFINTVLSLKMDVVIRVKDKNRLIIQDAMGLFHQSAAQGEFTKKNVQIKVWDESKFEMGGIRPKLRVLRFIEQHPKEIGPREMWVVTSLNDVDYTTIWSIMHKRWHIENNGFHQLKTYYHAEHCYVHEAVETVFMLIIVAFNLRDMFLFRKISDFRKMKKTKREVTELWRDSLLLYDYRPLALSG